MKKSERIRGTIRQYNKSELPRLRWTSELHQHFVQVVEGLGGKHKATPKRILQMMSVRGLELSHVKSHLQMYRSTKNRTTKDFLVPFRPLCDKTQDFTNLPKSDVRSLKNQVSNEIGRINERNLVQGQLFWNWKQIPEITSTTENLCENYPQETHGSALSVISKEEDVDRNGNFDDFEGFHSSMNETTQINLDLTISTCFSNSSIYK